MGTVTDFALLAVRLMLAAVFIIHGGQKLFKWMGGTGVEGTANGLGRSGVAPALRVPLAWLATLSEFGGGVLALLGLLTPLAGALIISVMLVAIVNVTGKNGWLNANKGYEFNLSLITLALVLILLGGGGVSLDHALGLAGPIDHDPAVVWVVLLLVILGGVGLNRVAQLLNRGSEAQPAAPSK